MVPDQQNLHRNKRGLAIDLKSEAGGELFRTLVKRADVVVAELPVRSESPARHRIRAAERDQSRHHPGEYFRLRPTRSLCAPPGR
ncbi:MAG: CoA transferase [Gammaproteobacteria bacterium]|nr:CoA transferase [Gammaproteobacteria bacterium]